MSVQMTESKELMIVDNICNRVYILRGQQVMLDYDLAEIYGYEVKRLNEQVKRNITSFRMRLRNKEFICLLQFLEGSLQSSKVYLLCVHFVKCVII